MVLLVHPGTQYSYQLARQLARHNKLGEFWTGLAIAKESWAMPVIETCLPYSWRRRLGNRIVYDVPAKRVRRKPFIGLKAVYQLRRGRSSQLVFHETNGEFQKKIKNSTLKKASAVIGFDTASWILARRAQEMGKPFFLDRSTSHPVVNDSVLQSVVRRFPEWQPDFEARISQVLHSESQEHHLATRIIAASSFTKRTLISQGIAADKIVVNPYGVDTRKFHPASRRRAERPLRFLFLGSVSARKGIPLLIEAWRSLNLKGCELWIVGPITPQASSLIPSLPGLKVFGKYPHEELPGLLRQCDVLVFPSYCDGFGLVLLEALASGLPVITTEATAGPDLIQNGVEGLIIQSGDLDELCRSIKYFADDPAKLQGMSEAARRCAEKFTWDAYGDRWNHLLEEFI
jgi:alpha-maltose-1-phosphate synthase